MASDIAVGIVVLAAAKKDERVKREEERRYRELVLRKEQITERRGKALELLNRLPLPSGLFQTICWR